MKNENVCTEAIMELGNVTKKVRDLLTDSIRDAVERHGGHIEFTDAVDECRIDAIYVTYDGGFGDPCYDSSEYNKVYAIDLGKDGHLIIDTERCYDYDFNKLDVHDIINVWNGIMEIENQ